MLCRPTARRATSGYPAVRLLSQLLLVCALLRGRRSSSSAARRCQCHLIERIIYCLGVRTLARFDLILDIGLAEKVLTFVDAMPNCGIWIEDEHAFDPSEVDGSNLDCME